MSPQQPRLSVSLLLAVFAALNGVEPARATDQGHFIMGFGFGPNGHFVRESYSALRNNPADTSAGPVLTSVSYSVWRSGASAQLQLGYAFSERLRLNLSGLGDLQYSLELGSDLRLSRSVRIAQAIFALGGDYYPGQTTGEWFVSGGAGYGMVPDYDAHGPAFFAGGGRDLGRVFQTRLVLGYLARLRLSELADYKADRLTVAVLLGMVRH